MTRKNAKVTAAARKLGLSTAAIYHRLSHGWTWEEATTLPKHTMRLTRAYSRQPAKSEPVPTTPQTVSLDGKNMRVTVNLAKGTLTIEQAAA